MLKHYFKTAIRNLAKQKVLAGINILGLSIGLACFILFLLYAVNEFTFDRFHKNASNIYRVYRWSQEMMGEPARGDTYMPMPLGPAMKDELPDVEDYVRMQDSWDEKFIKADDKITRSRISFADPQILKMFSFRFKSGDPSTALSDPHNIILTEKTVKKLFGNKDPIGKSVEIKEDEKFEPFIVSAVAENIPANSTISFDILGSFKHHEMSPSGKRSFGKWTRSSYQTYVQLRPGSKLPNDSATLVSFRSHYYPDEVAEFKKSGWTGTGIPVRFGLQPLNEMHTSTIISGGNIESIDPKNIWILLSIAGGVLLIACINFTTLSIGRSAGRSKEVGIRKVIGGLRSSIILQFLAEAFLLTLISAFIGLILAKLMLPYFNQLSGRELTFSFSQYPQFVWLLFALILVVGLLSGIYPSLILSRFKPIEVLKSKVRLGGSNIFTKSLVTVQFVLSVGLIISTVVIMRQLNFMRSANPGFNKENMIVVDADGTDAKKVYNLFRQAVINQPQVAGVAASEIALGEGKGWSRSGFEFKGKHKEVYEYFIDDDYLKVMGIPLLRGRNFDSRIAADSVTSVIINETMMRDFGWSIDSAVGQKLVGYSDKMDPIVIGVAKDFYYRPLSLKVEPQMFHQFAGYQPRRFLVHIKPGNPSEAITMLTAEWKKIIPDLPFQYSFLDEDVNRFYKAEARWSNIVGWAGGISIFLACLGLLGLASLAVVNRVKEIGIRKVLGASVPNIIRLLSGDFLKLVLIAFVIACPIAWYFMNKWLMDFANRISIGWVVFATTGVVVLAVALITISSQALRTALMNPVKSLRTE